MTTKLKFEVKKKHFYAKLLQFPHSKNGFMEMVVFNEYITTHAEFYGSVLVHHD